MLGLEPPPTIPDARRERLLTRLQALGLVEPARYNSAPGGYLSPRETSLMSRLRMKTVREGARKPRGTEVFVPRRRLFGPDNSPELFPDERLRLSVWRPSLRQVG
jgi:hypothetical protein